MVRACACGCGQPITHPWQRWATGHSPRKTASPHRGAAYRAERARLAPPHGAPCPRCGQPMTDHQHAAGLLDAGHSIDIAYGGHASPLRWEHRWCNRSAGAAQGNVARQDPPPRHW